MGGDITVISILGEGTVFKFEIPIELISAASIPERPASQRVIGLEKNQPIYRLLVVDDAWENRELLVTLLTTIGLEVREAANGQEALDLWASWKPHLIWMDMQMPVMNGYECTKEIRAREKDIEKAREGNDFTEKMPTLKFQTIIIALTASALEEERSVALSAGCNDFVRKPFPEEVIFEKMVKYLGMRYVYEELASPSPSQGAATVEELTPAALAAMPAEWLAQLHHAAAEGSDEVIFQLLEQIPEDKANVAKILAEWTNDFRFDKISKLSQ